jgi:hypothetical protein
MYFGNIYKYLTEEEIKTALLRQIESNNLQFLKPAFLEAWASRFWINKGYDGATFITDTTHPSIDVFIHDYLYRCFGGNKKADIIFYNLQLLLNDPKAKRNYFGVRVFGSYFRLKNKFKKIHSPISKVYEELYLYLFKL